MLKRLLTVGLALMLVVGFSGVALANMSYIEQAGLGGNQAYVDQVFGIWNYNWSWIDQFGFLNYADVDQDGCGNFNMSYIGQSGWWNRATVYQDGGCNINLSYIDQVGTGNVANVLQSGCGNYNWSWIEQYGCGNYADVDQSSGSMLTNFSWIDQDGCGNYAYVVQTGAFGMNSSVVVQSPYTSHNVAVVYQSQ